MGVRQENAPYWVSIILFLFDLHKCNHSNYMNDKRRRACSDKAGVILIWLLIPQAYRRTQDWNSQKLSELSLEKRCVPSLFIEIISLFQVLSAIALINRCVFVDIYLMLFNRIILLILQIDNYKMSIIYMCIHILIKVHTYLKLLSAVGPQDYKNKDPRQNLESIESQSICK